MALKHALLAVLTAAPMTGYDLVKYFDGSVTFLWNAPHSQIYPELRRMEAQGLVTAETVPRGERAEKRLYSISREGLAELQAWATALVPHTPERHLHRLRAAYFEWSTYEAARSQLREHLDHYTEALRNWEEVAAAAEARQVPLLRRRLEQHPEAEHEAAVAFKVFAFRGEISRARAEIAWAEQGLALLDDLQSRGVHLASQPPGALT